MKCCLSGNTPVAHVARTRNRWQKAFCGMVQSGISCHRLLLVSGFAMTYLTLPVHHHLAPAAVPRKTAHVTKTESHIIGSLKIMKYPGPT